MGKFSSLHAGGFGKRVAKRGNSTLGNTAGTADLDENKNSTKPQFSAFSAKGES